VGNLLALAAVTPFVGALSDLLGRRYVAMIGSVLIIIGVIIASVAQIMQVFIMGMIFAGAGAGICELTALAGAGELVPTKQRGIYIGLIVCTILPFCPAVLWAQLIAKTSWRYNGLFCALWSIIGLLLVIFFYFPPPRANSTGLSRREVLQRIDYIGGLLSISGLTLFLAGLQWGGSQYAWTSAHVLAPIIIGALLIIAFGVYEAWFVKFPMFPGRLKHDTWNLVLILLITAISGANFFAILIFWPTQSYSMYSPNAIEVGIRSLPIGFGIILGAILVSMAITVLKGRIRLLLTLSCVIMTAGKSRRTYPYAGFC
jgi:MFS family permease